MDHDAVGVLDFVAAKVLGGLRGDLNNQTVEKSLAAIDVGLDSLVKIHILSST